ncbi:TolC family protein [Budviciaceae bacterium CWB-B4]|uniref:TolC family protein n=1 Tax=Limnobaculum xujianqingii TaxID=2738837 RepID=A0A9D7AL81_9GAMM|nr:TolC family protein [Limnobaculum xujianqingii]MBK5074723.1 TolC family protein [Limnobaculum xujianqingii]MBK5177945.1 TolC family protein [Limnobaculum xujianqingii]
MKIKQLALLTLSLSVSLTTAISARVDDSLMQSLQPGRRAGVVNPPPPAMKKPVEPSIAVEQASSSEPVIIMPTPVSATPARSVQPAIVVPPPVAVATIGRDGKGWVADPPKAQPTIQPEPVSQPSPVTATTSHDNQVLELMDIDTVQAPVEPVVKSVNTPVVEPRPVSAVQNAVSTAPITTVGRDGKQWQVTNTPVKSGSAVASSHDAQAMEFVAIENTGNAPEKASEKVENTLLSNEPEPKRSSQNPAPVVAIATASKVESPVDVASQNINQTVTPTPVVVSKPVTVSPPSTVASKGHDTEQLSFTELALESNEPMTESTPIAPQATSGSSVTTLTRPAIQPASGKSKTVQNNDVVDTSAIPSKADRGVQQDILNWTVTDTSLAPVSTTSSADLYKSAPKLSSSGSNKASVDFIKNTVRQALVFSPEIRNAEASSTASRYDIDEIKGKRWPQVKVGANSPISNFGGGKSVNNSTDVSDTSGSVSMTTTVYDFGKTSSGIQSAEETSKASLELEKLTRNQIAFQTISGLLELDKYQKDIKVAKLYQSRMSDLVKMLSQITETDKGRGSELVQARSKLLQAQTNVQQLESKWRETQIKMTRLVGHEVEVPENLKWEGSDLSTQTILTALDHHPQILKAKAEVQASLHKADAIKSSSYPNINWVVSKSSAKDINGDEQAWYTGVNVEWDLFTGGSASASQQAAVQRAQATQMQFETTVLELKYKIRSMIQTRDSSFERAQEYRNLSADTDRVRTMFYEQWYYLGKRSLLDVLTAENDHFNNQISAINNQYDGYTANVSIMSESSMLLNWLGMPVY